MMGRKTIAILGATGSIGTQCLDILRQYPDHFYLQLVTANQKVDVLLRIANELHVPTIAFHGENVSVPMGIEKEVIIGRHNIAEYFQKHSIHTVVFGSSGVEDYDILLNIYPYVKRICIASKEIIVMAGSTGLLDTIQNTTQLLPVDSEHAAVYQLMERCPREHIHKVYLTASGGPFYSQSSNLSAIKWDQITPEMALKHPTWKMGKKVTIDSATMANKGIELLEARALFSLPPSQLGVVIHPQSIVHAMIESMDGVIYSQNSWPDMRLPIAFALFYPDRKAINIGKPEPFFSNPSSLTFHAVEADHIPTLASAYWALQENTFSPIVYLAADEVAVDAFLQSQISFLQIAKVIQEALQRYTYESIDALHPVEQFKKLQEKIRSELISN